MSNLQASNDSFKYDDLKHAVETIDREIETLEILKNNLDENLSKALDLLQNTKGRVIVTGMGKSGHIARKMAATFASTGTVSFFVHPAEASHGDLGMISDDDVIIAISYSGESKELSDILIYAKRHNIPLIAITRNPQSALGKNSSLVLKLPDNGEACPLGLAPTSSTTATIVLGDVLAVDLMERRGFSATDFRQRHPGGKLGAILCKVSDIMHKGDDVPLLKEDAIMQDALLVMSEKMLGCVGIVDNDGHLSGIITDGDLRRWMSPSIITEKVSKVMTKNPKVIGVKNSAEPVYLMERYASAVNNDDFIIFNGSDEQFLGGRLMGANAGIGGTYGCMPELFVELDRLINNNEIEKAKSLQFKINECIFDLLSCKSLYGVAKQVMSIRFGIECGNPRSPFLPVKREDAQPIADKINKYVSEIK